MGAPLEIAGAHKRTEKGNNDEYYGGGGVAHASTAAACAFVPLAVREGKTVGVWENGKVVEYIWHTDTSNTGLIKKTADVTITDRLKNTSDSFDGVLELATNGADKKGLRWSANSDTTRLYMRSTGDDNTQFVIEIGDNGPLNPYGVNDGFVVVKDLSGDGTTAPNYDMLTVTPTDLSYNPDGSGKKGIWHSGILPKGGPGQSIRVKADGSAFEAYDPATQVPVAANTAETINGTNTVKFVTPFNLAAWWTDVKTRIHTFTNLINFTGGLQKNGKDVATTDDVDTRQPKEPGKGLYPDLDKSKVASIIQGYTMSWSGDYKSMKVYYEGSATIANILIDGAASLSYSTNGGATYIPVTFPFAGTIPIPAGWLRWRITYATGSETAAAYIKHQ